MNGFPLSIRRLSSINILNAQIVVHTVLLIVNGLFCCAGCVITLMSISLHCTIENVNIVSTTWF